MTVSRSLRFTILARDGFECVYCHSTEKPLEVDHVRAVALGGTDSPENLVAACEDCNGGKAASHLGSLESMPRPTALHQAGELAFLQERYREMEAAVARSQRREAAAEQRAVDARSAQKATAKQLQIALGKVQVRDQELIDRASRADSRATSAIARALQVEHLCEIAAGVLDDFEAYIKDNGWPSPDWRDGRIDEIRQMAELVPARVA